MASVGAKPSTTACSREQSEALIVDYMSTRNEYVAQGMPEDFLTAMVEEDYMEDLIKATDHQADKRKKNMSRYLWMNQAVVIFLVGQALLGIWLTLYGTVLAPKKDYSTTIELEDADMVVMIDASNHLSEDFKKQRDTVKAFTTSLFAEIQKNRGQAVDEALARMIEAKKQDMTIFQKWFGKNPETDTNHAVRKFGGWLRVSANLFNSEVKDIHPLVYDENLHVQKLMAATDTFHNGDSKWKAAMDQCRQMIETERLAAKNALGDDPESFRRAERCYSAQLPTDTNCADFDKKLELCPGRYCEKLEVQDGDKKNTVCRDRKPFCRKQFCVVIGDSDAMCAKRHKTGSNWETKINEFCTKSPEACPDEGHQDHYGNPVEWAPEMEECQEIAETLRENSSVAFRAGSTVVDQNYIKSLNDYNDITMIMIFTAATEAEKQMRLKSESFRKFVFNVLDCDIKSKTAVMKIGTKEKYYDEYFIDRNSQSESGQKNCLRFVMETDPKEVLARAKDIKDLLQFSVKDESKPSSQRDGRWAFFLLLCLNIPIYLGWTYIVKWYAAMNQRTQRAMGAKKKMIKVTKNLVEKSPDVIAGKAAPGMGELELQEFQKTKVPIEFGWDVTLRSRLKGTYVQADRNAGCANGNGKPFERQAAWSFEPVDTVDNAQIGSGQAFTIRNYKGQYLCATASGTKFVDDMHEGARGACHFMVDPVDESNDQAYCGDAIRLKNVHTGAFLRCDKEGNVNVSGDAKEPETQFIVDMGGQPITSGALVTLHADANFSWLHGTPMGHVHAGDDSTAGYEERDWRPWVIEKAGGGGIAAKKSMAKTEYDDDDFGGAIGKKKSLADDAVDKAITKGALKEGDIVTLKALNLRMLEANEKTRKIDCCKSDDNDPDANSTVEYEIHRIGISQVTKHNNTIRRGCQICLKPVHIGNKNRELCDYLKIEDDGSVSSTGNLLDKEIVITIDIAPFQGVVTPLTGDLERGDAEVFFTNLEKKESSCKVATSAWTNKESIRALKGLVVVAENGMYSPPKGGDPWVAVIQEGVDIFSAARQAKAQGATGIIVITAEACSQDRLALGADGVNVPELPCVFVHEDGAQVLKEKGLVIKGGEVKKEFISELMRSIGKTKGPADFPDVFMSAGRAMIERYKERQNYKSAAQASHDAARDAEDRARMEMEQAQPTDGNDQSKFKWKTNANTAYYWAKSGGGANVMKVNFGKKAPPSAVKERVDASGKKLGADSSQHHNDARKSVKIGIADPHDLKRTRLSVVNMPAEDMRNLDLAGNLMMWSQSDADRNMHHMNSDLGAESDFKIEYSFEEIEVGIDEKPEDLDEEAFMEDAGQVIKTVGVPRKYFYLIIAVMLFTTVVLLIILLLALQKKPKEARQIDGQPPDLTAGVFASLWAAKNGLQAVTAASIADSPFMQKLQSTGFLSNI